MTAQEIFDKVATHLLRQGKKSEGPGKGCLYRGPNGLKCAAGFLIDDAYYDPKFEGKGVGAISKADTPNTVLLNEALLKSGVPAELFDFVGELQGIHDDYWPEYWREMLANTAKANSLSAAVLDEVQP